MKMSYKKRFTLVFLFLMKSIMNMYCSQLINNMFSRLMRDYDQFVEIPYLLSTEKSLRITKKLWLTTITLFLNSLSVEYIPRTQCLDKQTGNDCLSRFEVVDCLLHK